MAADRHRVKIPCGCFAEWNGEQWMVAEESLMCTHKQGEHVDGAPPSRHAVSPADQAQATADLAEAVKIQQDTISRLVDSVRLLKHRVEQLERDRPTRNIG